MRNLRLFLAIAALLAGQAFCFAVDPALASETGDVGPNKNTVVVFVSDNGGFAGAAHMGRLRGAKSTTFEGGIRVPLIIRWPGRIPAGTQCDQVSATVDLTRSFLQLTGARVSAERLDGYDIIDRVVQQRDDCPRTLF